MPATKPGGRRAAVARFASGSIVTTTTTTRVDAVTTSATTSHLLELLPPYPLGVSVPLPFVLLELLHLRLVEPVEVVLEKVQVPEAVDVDLVVAPQLALQLVQLVGERRPVGLDGAGWVDRFERVVPCFVARGCSSLFRPRRSGLVVSCCCCRCW